jgi:putative drug exporter of the RND superfamily
VSQSENPEPSSCTRSSLFARIGNQVVRLRSIIVGLWVLFMVASLALTPQLERSLRGAGMNYEAGEARQTERLLQQELNLPADPLIIVFQASAAQALKQAQPALVKLLTQIRQSPGVTSATDAQQHQSPDGRTQYSIIRLQQSDSDAIPAIDRINQILNREVPKTLQTFVTGKTVVDRDVLEISKADLARAEFIALPLTLVALLFVFGSIVAATLPIAMGVLTVSATFGLLYFIAQQMEMSVFALNFTSMLGLGLGIDYSLLMVNRFREELQNGSVSQSVIRTVDTAGRAVFVSGITVCISLVCLLLFPISVLRSIGIAGSLVVLLSVTAALTLLPALLTLIGHRIDWRMNGRNRTGQITETRSGFWAVIARQVTRHTVASIAVVLAIVVFLSAPFLKVHFGLGDASILPRSVPSREGIERLQQAFGPSEMTPILLAVRTANPTDRILSPQHLATLSPLIARLSNDQRVENVRSLLNIDPRFTLQDYQRFYQQPLAQLPPPLATAVQTLSNPSTQLMVIRSRSVSHDAVSHTLVKELRSLSLPGLTLQVGGQTASEMDTLQQVSERFPFALAGIMGVTFAVLSLLFNSVILPLKAILMNFLSIGASFGALVFIFQEGHFKEWLNFTPLGYLDILLPLVLFCVVFGLSMDYEVFLLTRIKEAYDDCGNNSKSVIEGLERTGWIITSAAGLMIIVTGAFTLTSIIFMKALGLGIALAVLIDATLIRVILVPATMHLMGRWNWWLPRFLRPNRAKSSQA